MPEISKLAPSASKKDKDELINKLISSSNLLLIKGKGKFHNASESEERDALIIMALITLEELAKLEKGLDKITLKEAQRAASKQAYKAYIMLEFKRDLEPFKTKSELSVEDYALLKN